MWILKPEHRDRKRVYINHFARKDSKKKKIEQEKYVNSNIQGGLVVFRIVSVQQNIAFTHRRVSHKAIYLEFWENPQKNAFYEAQNIFH